ncbi:CLUMA_CG019660, isoform A [Clunio marinus]|uniref:CLUMA_CG019660, isoform A n=1 Tax=Clunio marinus TaxID=568069 RepID=A0A1J1J371_9DIPT|nr:CLUMA_CG019660, isoform A [Clunio marinus]
MLINLIKLSKLTNFNSFTHDELCNCLVDSIDLFLQSFERRPWGTILCEVTTSLLANEPFPIELKYKSKILNGFTVVLGFSTGL